jgi:hypothetical protein
MVLVQVQGELVRIANVSPNEKAFDLFLPKMIGCGDQCFLVEVSPDKEQWVGVQMFPPQRILHDNIAQVQQQRTVSAPHIAQPLGLVVERPVKNLFHDVVQMGEVRFVRSS